MRNKIRISLGLAERGVISVVAAGRDVDAVRAAIDGTPGRGTVIRHG